MRMKLLLPVAGMTLALTVGTAMAHHAFTAEFDSSKPVKLRGTVTRMEWVNPHAWIHMDVKEPDGKVTAWMIETGSPNSLLRRGITKYSVPAGAEIVVEGYQAKDGSPRANGRELTTADGKRLFMGAEGTGSPGSPQ